jgi:hypothetical protein
VPSLEKINWHTGLRMHIVEQSFDLVEAEHLHKEGKVKDKTIKY